MTEQGKNKLGKNFALVALLKTLHENGHDSWSAFTQLTLAVISSGQTLEQVLIDFFATYKVELPREVAYTVLAKLKRENYINYSRKDGPYTLSDAGEEKANEAIESASSFKKDFDLLVDDLKAYLGSKSIKLKSADKELINFIDSNLAFTVEALTKQPGKKAKAEAETEIANYILRLEQRNKTLFSILQNLFFGRLYLQTFKAQAPISKQAKFSNLTIIIDTNIIFNLLGLHGNEEKRSTLALIDTLTHIDGVTVKCLDITITEAKRTLLNAAESKNLTKDIEVDGLPWRLKKLGYDSLTITTLTEGLEDRLAKLAIIEQLVTVSAAADDISTVRALSESFRQYKGELSIEHDATILTLLKEYRKGVHTGLLEKSKYVFLSTDNALIVHSKKKAESTKSFPMTISPVELSCLVWLKDIGNEKIMKASLRQALMVYAREKMLASGLWQKFVECLEDARQKGEIGDEEIALLIDSQNTKSLLYEKGENAIKEVLNESNIKKLRAERFAADKFQKKAKNQQSRIRKKKSKIASLIATTLTGIVAIFASAITILTVLFALKAFGIDGVANSAAIGVILLALISALNFGKVPKIDHVVQLRKAVNKYFYAKASYALERIFY